MAGLYTKEEESKISQMYAEGVPPAQIGEAVGKTARSVISKLSKMGIYKKAVYLTKTGENPELKADIVADIERLLELDPGELVSLDKPYKATLKKLRDSLQEWFGNK